MASGKEAFQREESIDLLEGSVAQFVVVESVLTLELHGSQSHANPGIELVELLAIGSK
jgi:hypothetical protein